MTQEKADPATRRRWPHTVLSRTRRCALALLVALLGVAASPAASGAADAVGSVTLRQCLLSGVNFPADHDHLAQYVPDGHALGTFGDAGVVAIWVFSCDGATAGRGLGPAQLSVVGVLLDDETDLTDPATWPNGLAPLSAVDQPWAANWPQYVVWAHSDNGGLAAALKGMGMPVTVVRDMSFLEDHVVEPVGEPVDVPDVDTCSRIGPAPGPGHSPPDDVRLTEPHKTTNVSVPWRGQHGYETSTVLPVTPHNTVTHCHDQLLKHGPSEGGSTVHVSIPVARDHFCSHPQPDCGQAQAQPGSPVAGLLGGAERDDPVVAFDHERIPEVLIEAR